MSNITIQQQASDLRDIAAGKLTRTESGVAAVAIPAENNPRISDMGGAQISRIIAAITLKAAVRLGSKARDAEEQKIINRELNNDLMKFPMMTEREIMAALENGLDGMYLKKPEDPVIFSPSNFVQWIRAYIEQTKKPVMKKVAQLVQQQNSEEWDAPESEKLKMSHDFFLTIMKRVLDGEAYEDYGNVVYSFLEKIGFLPLSAEDKWKAMDMAKLKIIAEAREIKDPIVQRTSVKNAMELIEKAQTEKPDDAIISMAKRILISNKLASFKNMPVEEQTDLLEAIQTRVEYLCIELKNPEQYGNPG
ncbi:hypothetical protein [Dyadobacter sp. OTU695]|uniref:hypothetical protein n=1 Tax=Dyadobacter sp. OTU695 TaxID=3043860 RepID=UPI00313C20F0